MAAACHDKQGNFEEIVMSQPAYGFVTYLMEYAFTLTFSSREFPPTCEWCIARDSINPLVTLTFELLTSK